MNLPDNNTIEKVNALANSLADKQGLSFNPVIKDTYCSLIPSTDKEVNMDLVRTIRKKFKGIFIWINETSSNYSIDYALKY